MKSAVITFPGSNCDDDCIYTLKKNGFSVDNLWHKDLPDLSSYQLIVLPGGFSYGDYLRCGAMASVLPIIEKVKAFANKGGLVLGICNGFQILCETRLLPGALVRNKDQKFISADVDLVVSHNDNPWTNQFSVEQKISLPIAHGDGRFVFEEKDKANFITLLKYQNTPNGSQEDIAGICNLQKNVFGLMPHPERASDLKSKQGLKFWQSIAQFVKDAP
jgi:phosphoribosylformylglycinamidine synthase